MAEKPIIEVQGLTKRFKGLTAVHDVSFSVEKGSITGMIGPNGAGKSTTFNMICGYYPPTEGKIFYNGEDITNKKAYEYTNMKIARTFQNIRLFSNLSVEDNVKLGLHNHINYNMWSGILRLPRYWNAERLAHERAMELLSIFDMGYLAKYKAGSLPYGDQRKLEIVRALATNPSLLLLDEPAAGLDPEGRDEILSEVKEYHKKTGTTVLLVSHSMEDIAKYANRVLVMSNKKIAMYDTVEKVFARAPELLELREDHGGNTVIRRHEADLLLLDVPAEELHDVDTAQALEELKAEEQV